MSRAKIAAIQIWVLGSIRMQRELFLASFVLGSWSGPGTIRHWKFKFPNQICRSGFNSGGSSETWTFFLGHFQGRWLCWKLILFLLKIRIPIQALVAIQILETSSVWTSTTMSDRLNQNRVKSNLKCKFKLRLGSKPVSRGILNLYLSERSESHVHSKSLAVSSFGQENLQRVWEYDHVISTLHELIVPDQFWQSYTDASAQRVVFGLPPPAFTLHFCPSEQRIRSWAFQCLSAVHDHVLTNEYTRSKCVWITDSRGSWLSGQFQYAWPASHYIAFSSP